VRELKLLVGETAVTTRDKVALVNRTIDQTQRQFSLTTAFIQLIAIAMVAMAVVASRAVKMIHRLEERVEPLIAKVGALSEQGKEIAAQGKEIAEQFTVVSGHLSTATMHFSESLALIKDEVRELKLLVGETAVTTRDKVALVNRTIDQTQRQFSLTTAFIQSKVIEPARELAAIMAGFRRGLEVLVAPTPKPINQTYQDEEMFIG
jgi:predicted component of type VI protein secretion system